MTAQLMTSDELATYLNLAPITIRMSRCSGKLLGKPAPKFIKLGRNVRYKKTEVDRWLADFQDFTNTAESLMQGVV